MDTDALVGKTIEEVRKICNDSNMKHRVVCEDGKSYVITADLVPERANFVVEKGIVIEVYGG
jgi:hypothetical protein